LPDRIQRTGGEPGHLTRAIWSRRRPAQAQLGPDQVGDRPPDQQVVAEDVQLGLLGNLLGVERLEAVVGGGQGAVDQVGEGSGLAGRVEPMADHRGGLGPDRAGELHRHPQHRLLVRVVDRLGQRLLLGAEQDQARALRVRGAARTRS
jgi:hypothetical protein